jgi:hypothetical protein
MESNILFLGISFLLGLVLGTFGAMKYNSNEQTELMESFSDKVAVIEELRDYIKTLDDKISQK